ATKRLSHGLSFTSTFTWQKNTSISGNREPNFGTAANGSVNDVFNRRNNKYISAYSQPLVFLTSINYTTPKVAFGRGMTSKALSWLVQDWPYGPFPASRSGLRIMVPLPQTPPSLNSLPFQGTFANRVPGQPLFLKDLNCHCFDPRNEFVLNPKAWT